MSAPRKNPPGSIGAKLIVWSIAAVGSLVMAYLAWLHLPVGLWHWANAAWWHWVVAIWVFPLLLFFPVLLILGGGWHLIAATRAGARSALPGETLSYLGFLGVS